MKNRIALCIVISLVILASPLASQNLQKVFSIDSDVYEAMSFLYMEQGKSVPSSSGPWSADELASMLNRINRATLSPQGKDVYDYVEGEILAPPRSQPSQSFGASTGLDITLEGYMHTNTDDPGFFTDEQDWVYGFEDREPFLNIPFETWAADNFYGYFELPVMVNQFHSTNDTSYVFNNSFTTNVFLIPPNQLGDLNFNIPYRAFVSAGGDHWNFQMGRDRVKWGSGQTGNLIVGGHMMYNEYMKFSTYHDTFKFTSLAMAFPHPIDYGYSSQDLPASGSVGSPDGQSEPINGLRMFISHRLEFRILDIINLAVTEGMMFMSEDGTFDLRFLNPAMLYHDFYIRDNSNSILGLDIEINPWENLNLYGQLAVDEFALPGEPTSGPGTNPEAYGVLGGIKGILPLGPGMLFGSFEAAKTDPYLYLRDFGDYHQDVGEYGINFVVGIREFTPAGNISVMEDFLGYEYGNDAVVMNLNGGYTVFGKYRIEGNLFYMMHGTHDMYTLWEQGSSFDADDPSIVDSPTTSPSTGNQYDAVNNANSRDAIEHTLALGLKGSYSIMDNLEVYAQVDWLNKTNPGNFSSNPPESDLQATFGITYGL